MVTQLKNMMIGKKIKPTYNCFFVEIMLTSLLLFVHYYYFFN